MGARRAAHTPSRRDGKQITSRAARPSTTGRRISTLPSLSAIDLQCDLEHGGEMAGAEWQCEQHTLTPNDDFVHRPIASAGQDQSSACQPLCCLCVSCLVFLVWLLLVSACLF